MNPAIWMSGSLLSFCLMAVGVRELSITVGTSQVLLFRSLIGLFVVTLIIVIAKNNRLFKTNRTPLHVIRNLFHFFGQYGWFVGISLLPLAEVFALEFTVPVWTVIISAFVLKEGITIRKTLAIALGVTGVVVIVKPGGDIFDVGTLIVLAAAVCYSISHVSTKSLSSSEHPLTVLFYMCLIQLPVAFLLTGTNWVYPAALEWFWLFIVGLTALTAHYCITQAMRLAEAGVVVTLDFLRLPLISLVGIFLYGESFDSTLFVGAALMLVANLANLYKPKSTSSQLES